MCGGLLTVLANQRCVARLQLLSHLKLNSKQNKTVKGRTKELVGSGFSE